MQFKFSSPLVLVLAAFTVQAAPIGKAVILDLTQRATQVPAGVDITITAGSEKIGANHFGCADITPAGKDSQLVCTSEFTSTGFKLSVKDNHTGVRSTCQITGTTGTCGPSGAGAKLSSLPKREFEEDLEERATQVPAGVDITITAGSKKIGANHFGCADITPTGKDSQLVCTSEFTSTGFKLSVKDNHTGIRSTCQITGTTGTCGPSGAGAQLSSLPKRDFEEDVDEREDEVDERAFEEDFEERDVNVEDDE